MRLFLAVLLIITTTITADASGRRYPKRSDFPAGTKFVAITFDDGPNTTWTVQVLDKLATHGAKATFYVQGQKITQETTPILQRMIAEGHDVCNHSWDHPTFGQPIPDTPPPPRITTVEAARENLQKTSQAIFDATGYWPFSFRAPFLEFEAALFGAGIDVLLGLDREFNMAFVDTGIDPADFNNQSNPAGIAGSVTRYSDAVLDGGIILLHDCGADYRGGTVASLDIMLPALKARGFEIVTVRELFMIKGVVPEQFRPALWPRVNQRVENPSLTWRRWEFYDPILTGAQPANFGRLFPDNMNDWWEQDWWTCPTPPWDRWDGTKMRDCDVQYDCDVCKDKGCAVCDPDNVCEICGAYKCTKEHKICEECGKYDVDCDCGGTSIHNVKKSDNRYGIRFAQNPTSDKAEISVILPSNAQIAETKIAIYDMTGNVVFVGAGSARPIIWDLRNSAGRFVANSTYLVVAEVRDRNGKTHIYSARLGVNR